MTLSLIQINFVLTVNFAKLSTKYLQPASRLQIFGSSHFFLLILILLVLIFLISTFSPTKLPPQSKPASKSFLQWQYRKILPNTLRTTYWTLHIASTKKNIAGMIFQTHTLFQGRSYTFLQSKEEVTSISSNLFGSCTHESSWLDLWKLLLLSCCQSGKAYR